MKAMILALSLVTSISFCSAVSAQLTKVTIGNNTLSTNGLPAWMAKESGIFARNGLDVQIVYFRGGTITTMALISPIRFLSMAVETAVKTPNLESI